MPSKQFELADVGTITIVKRAASRSLRLSIRSDGQILVSIPSYASYRSGLAFAASKSAWLQQNTTKPAVLVHGQAVGKAHHLQLLPTRGVTTPRTLVSKTTIMVRYPVALTAESPEVQLAATTACIRALRAQATQLLPMRLKQLAMLHGFEYSAVSIKRLKGRWGSCDNHQRIVLNLFLMQLPWECIDYVLLHELTHTQVLRHGPPFWERMSTLIPNLAAIRKQMRIYQPVLQSPTQTVQ